MRKKIIFHIGMPKCASSSIQYLLSGKRFYESCHNECIYLVIQADGSVLEGSEILRRDEYYIYGYLTSAPADILVKHIDRVDFERIGSALRRTDRVIFSTEWWGYELGAFLDFFEEFLRRFSAWLDEEVEIRILMYIRPQVEWLNSAFWQWGAWEFADFSEFLENYKPRANWLSAVESVVERTGTVPDIIVMHRRGNAVRDFMEYLGIEGCLSEPELSGLRLNRSTPEVIVRLYQKYRTLRPGPHASALDFILKRFISVENYAPTPWVLSQDLVEELIEYYRPFNRGLVEYLNEREREKLLTEERYWSAKEYSERSVRPIFSEPETGELERLCVELIERLSELYMDHIRMQREYDLRIEDLERECARLRAEAGELSEELRRVYSSRSWKLTEPLRRLRALLSGRGR